MNTKPVFESFSGFVDFLSNSESPRMILEKEMTVEEFMNALSSFFDDGAKQAFLGFKDVLAGSPFYTSDEAEASLKNVKSNLGGFASQIENYQKDEDNEGIVMDYLGTFSTDIVITQMVSGKVKYIGGLPGTAVKSKDWNPIENVLANANRLNIYYSNRLFPDLKGKKWIKDDGVITNSGSLNQRVISSIDSGINFVNLEVGTNPTVLEASNMGGAYNLGEVYGKDDFKDWSVTRQIVLYTIKKVRPSVGDEVPSNYIKKEFSTLVIPGEVVELSRVLDGTDKMFAQGQSTLAKDKQELTNKTIDQLLGEFSAIESINIVGGASYEGGLEVNKKLVAGRATTVKDLIEKNHPELKGKVTADTTDFSKIQPEDKPDEYTKWRKIYLNIKGNVIGDSKTVTQEKSSVFGAKIKFDEVTLTQWILNFEFSKPEKFKK